MKRRKAREWFIYVDKTGVVDGLTVGHRLMRDVRRGWKKNQTDWIKVKEVLKRKRKGKR